MRLRTLTRTMGATIAAASVAVASVGVAHADNTAPPGPERPSALAKVIARGDFSIDRRLATIAELAGVVHNDPSLTPQHRATVQAQLNHDGTALRALRARIDAASSKAAAQRAFNLIAGFHIYNLVVPKVQLLVASDGMGGAALNLQLDLGEVDGLLPAAPASPAQSTTSTPIPEATTTTTVPSQAGTVETTTVPLTPASAACRLDPRDCTATTSSTAPAQTTSTTAVLTPASAACQVDPRDCTTSTTTASSPMAVATPSAPSEPSTDDVSSAKDNAAGADATAGDVQNEAQQVSDTVVSLDAKDFNAARSRLGQERDRLARLRAELERVRDALNRLDALLQRLQDALAASATPSSPAPATAPTTIPTTAPTAT